MLKKLFSIIVLCFCISAANAQELKCMVTVMADRIQGVDPQVFKTMEKSISDFMNTRKWTTDEFAVTEKINCNVLINITKRNGADGDSYTANINISANRPVYGSDYSTPTVNYMDRDLVFSYSQFNPLQFDDNRVVATTPIGSNLTAVLAFYAYIIIGLDYESFSPNGGTPHFKRALNIVNNAPQDGKSIPGWTALENNRNRYWIIDQLLNTRFQELRNYWYSYHREYMDNMSLKPVESQKKILAGLTKLQQVQKENPGSILMQFIFAAKSDEFIRMLNTLPKQERAQYATLLAQIDISNVAKYNNLKDK
jgi:hypothetical protein